MGQDAEGNIRLPFCAQLTNPCFYLRPNLRNWPAASLPQTQSEGRMLRTGGAGKSAGRREPAANRRTGNTRKTRRGAYMIMRNKFVVRCVG
jgi:hypothetical protein